MTTKVKISIAQRHMPVVVEVLRSDGTVAQTQTLREIGDAAEEYVHSGQTLRVREMTTQEAHDDGTQAAFSGLAMKGSDPEDLPPLGEKIERPKPAEPAPKWKPLRPGYETDGSAVRRIPEGNAMNPWSKCMKDLGRTSP